MIWKDERRSPADRLGVVLHLGDFVYEIIRYPEDRPQGYYARHIRDIVRYAHGEKHNDFHVPTTVEDYRALYRACLLDPDLQDARARWPFVCVPDNHEFSWKGWQSQESFGATLPAQARKVAGANAELILTDNRSYRSEPLTTRPEAAPLRPTDFPGVVSEDVTELLDAGGAGTGAALPNATPPETIHFGGVDVPNPRRTARPLSMLGATQKAWFLDRLRAATTPWKCACRRRARSRLSRRGRVVVDA